MAFIFTMRTSHRHGDSTATADDNLSVIMENGDDPAPPPIPPKASGRTPHRRIPIGFPPSRRGLDPPPPYSVYEGVRGPKGERLNDLRNNKFVAKRGGWKRFCLIALIASTIIAGLVVGLVVGLWNRDRNRNRLQAATPSPSANPIVGGFPAGSYNIEVYLAAVATNCTSNPDTFSCGPYSNPTGQPTQYQWIINMTAPNTFKISSTNNPFMPMFSMIPLTLLDSGMPTERWHFSRTYDMAVVPSSSITPNNVRTTCYYNGTTMEADLYTKMRANYPNNSTAPSPNGSMFRSWGSAVSVTLKANGGDNTPNCYTLNGGSLGQRVTDGFTARPSGSTCQCRYKNTDEL
ncbi:MAG: hypothetical protein M1814_005435 [Vezdaea aestivalis]|nr:MAG: hypothetical protein M1814_005435 [Vezdaea aestivalis]